MSFVVYLLCAYVFVSYYPIRWQLIILQRLILTVAKSVITIVEALNRDTLNNSNKTLFAGPRQYFVGINL